MDVSHWAAWSARRSCGKASYSGSAQICTSACAWRRRWAAPLTALDLFARIVPGEQDQHAKPHAVEARQDVVQHVGKQLVTHHDGGWIRLVSPADAPVERRHQDSAGPCAGAFADSLGLEGIVAHRQVRAMVFQGAQGHISYRRALYDGIKLVRQQFLVMHFGHGTSLFGRISDQADILRPSETKLHTLVMNPVFPIETRDSFHQFVSAQFLLRPEIAARDQDGGTDKGGFGHRTCGFIRMQTHDQIVISRQRLIELYGPGWERPSTSSHADQRPRTYSCNACVTGDRASPAHRRRRRYSGYSCHIDR